MRSYTLSVNICNECPHNCPHCKDVYQSKELPESQIDFIKDFCSKTGCVLNFEGREPLLKPNLLRKMCNWNLPTSITTTGIHNVSVLEELFQSCNIKKLLISCHGSPDVECSVRRDLVRQPYENRKWMLKYLGTPLAGAFLISHVIYVPFILNDEYKDNLEWVLENYPSVPIMICLDAHDDYGYLKSVLREMAKYLVRIKSKYPIYVPINSDSVTLNVYGSNISLLMGEQKLIPFKNVKPTVDFFEECEAIKRKERKSKGCPFYNLKETFCNCTTCHCMSGEIESCRILTNFYRTIKDG